MRSKVQHAKAASKWDIATLIYRELMTEKQWQGKKSIHPVIWQGRNKHFPSFQGFALGPEGKVSVFNANSTAYAECHKSQKSQWPVMSLNQENSFKRKETLIFEIRGYHSKICYLQMLLLIAINNGNSSTNPVCSWWSVLPDHFFADLVLWPLGWAYWLVSIKLLISCPSTPSLPSVTIIFLPGHRMKTIPWHFFLCCSFESCCALKVLLFLRHPSFSCRWCIWMHVPRKSPPFLFPFFFFYKELLVMKSFCSMDRCFSSWQVIVFLPNTQVSLYVLKTQRGTCQRARLLIFHDHLKVKLLLSLTWAFIPD